MTTAEKKIIVIAGPNGAGKTTFANQILAGDQSGFPFVNADIIPADSTPKIRNPRHFGPGG